MDARQLFTIEALAKVYSGFVSNFSRQSDGLGDDMVRGQNVVGQPKVLERPKDLNDASVIFGLEYTVVVDRFDSGRQGSLNHYSSPDGALAERDRALGRPAPHYWRLKRSLRSRQSGVDGGPVPRLTTSSASGSITVARIRTAARTSRSIERTVVNHYLCSRGQDFAHSKRPSSCLRDERLRCAWFS